MADKIAIIGAGNVGSALAKQFIKAGYEVLIGAKLPLSHKSGVLAAEIGIDRFSSVESVVKESDVIIFALPPDAVVQLLPPLGKMEGKILVDATNSVRIKPDPYPTVYHALKTISGSDLVVKCFNTTGYENLLNPVYNDEKIDMFFAGDSVEAKAVVKELALKIGFGNCYDFGGHDKVELLEKLALCWINLAIQQGMGRNIAFKLIHR